MPTFFLIDDGNSMPRWSELAIIDGASFWVDLKARRIPKGAGQPIAHAEGHNIEDAITRVPDAVVKLERDFGMNFLLDPWSDQGWVSPDGRFYGCAFFAHDDIAYSLIRKSPGALEVAGWIRVHADSFRTGELRPSLTRLQEETILCLGFEDVYPGARRKPGFSIDRNGPAPHYAIKPRLRITPIVPPPKREAPRTDVSVLELIERLAAHSEFGSIIATPQEVIPDVGGGEWLWMSRYDDFDLGGADDPESILSASGIHLMATSFNTIEISPWPFPGIEIDDGARVIFREAAAQQKLHKANLAQI